MFDLINHFGIDAVEQPSENRLARIPHDAQDRDGDAPSRRWDQPGENRTRHPRARQYSQAGQPINACMITVSDEGSAVDLFAHPDPEHCNDLIACKSDQGRERTIASCSMGWGCRNRSIDWYPATIALNRIVSTMMTPARSSTRP